MGVSFGAQRDCKPDLRTKGCCALTPRRNIRGLRRQMKRLKSCPRQNWMRDYDPTLGRYLQADPLGLVDGASIYGYALQNPGRYTDPTGEFIPALAWYGMSFAFGYAMGEEWQSSGGNWRCWNYPNIGASTLFGGLGGGAGNIAKSFGPQLVKNFLSKGAKGRAGEALS